MAQTPTAETGHPAMDYAEHDRTYSMFLVMVKWGIILNVALLIFMAFFLL